MTLRAASDRLAALVTEFNADHEQLREHSERARAALAEVTALLAPDVCGRARLVEINCYLPDGHGGPHVALTRPEGGAEQEFWNDPEAERPDVVEDGRCGVANPVTSSGIRCERESGHTGVHSSPAFIPGLPLRVVPGVTAWSWSS